MDRVKEQLQKTSPDFNECHTQSQTGPAKPLEKLGQCFFLMFKITGGVEEIYSEIDMGLKTDHLIEEEI